MKLWNELNDRQAENISGGEGIGGGISAAIEFYRENGYTPKEFAELTGVKNIGKLVSAYAQIVNGPL